jgi:hypothetical protein
MAKPVLLLEVHILISHNLTGAERQFRCYKDTSNNEDAENVNINCSRN